MLQCSGAHTGHISSMSDDNQLADLHHNTQPALQVLCTYSSNAVTPQTVFIEHVKHKHVSIPQNQQMSLWHITHKLIFVRSASIHTQWTDSFGQQWHKWEQNILFIKPNHFYPDISGSLFMLLTGPVLQWLTGNQTSRGSKRPHASARKDSKAWIMRMNNVLAQLSLNPLKPTVAIWLQP